MYERSAFGGITTYQWRRFTWLSLIRFHSRLIKYKLFKISIFPKLLYFFQYQLVEIPIFPKTARTGTSHMEKQRKAHGLQRTIATSTYNTQNCAAQWEGEFVTRVIQPSFSECPLDRCWLMYHLDNVCHDVCGIWDLAAGTQATFNSGS